MVPGVVDDDVVVVVVVIVDVSKEQVTSQNKRQQLAHPTANTVSKVFYTSYFAPSKDTQRRRGKRI